MTPSTYSAPRQQHAHAPQQVMDRLFLRLTAFYGTKLADAYAGISMESLQAMWAEELGGYSLDEINAGVQACRSLKWPPTLPEFLAYCRPPVNVEASYFEAVTNMGLREKGQHPRYTHPAIYWVADEIGPWDLRNVPHRFMAARWADAMRRQLAKGQWKEVPPPPLRLEPPVTRPPNEAERAALASLATRF